MTNRQGKIVDDQKESYEGIFRETQGRQPIKMDPNPAQYNQQLRFAKGKGQQQKRGN